MAWTAPIKAIVGTLIDAPGMNTYWSNNFSELDQNDHGGGSGSGTRALGGTVGLTTVTFANAAAPAAPTGTLTRLFSSGSMLGWRSSGGTARMGVDTNHTHGY